MIEESKQQVSNALTEVYFRRKAAETERGVRTPNMVVLTPLLTLIVPSWSPPHFGANFSCLKSEEKPPISFEISGFYGKLVRNRYDVEML